MTLPNRYSIDDVLHLQPLCKRLAWALACGLLQSGCIVDLLPAARLKHNCFKLAYNYSKLTRTYSNLNHIYSALARTLYELFHYYYEITHACYEISRDYSEFNHTYSEFIQAYSKFTHVYTGIPLSYSYFLEGFVKLILLTNLCSGLPAPYTDFTYSFTSAPRSGIPVLSE